MGAVAGGKKCVVRPVNKPVEVLSAVLADSAAVVVVFKDEGNFVVGTVLKSYLHQRAPKEPGTQPVFLNANGAPITRFGIRYITRKYGAQAQVKQRDVTVKRVNPHTIRHTSAMHLLRAGNDINMVSYWLGHADINTTHIYVEIDMEMKRKMIAKAGAPDVGNKTPWQQPDVLQWLNQLVKKL